MTARVIPLTPVPSSEKRVKVAELAFDRVTMREAVRAIVRMARKHDRARYVCTGNLDHLVIADRNEAFRQAYVSADLVVADGAPIVWLSRLASAEALPERVAGSDLFWEVARASSECGLRVFLLGGLPGSAPRAALAIAQRYPKARVIGTYCPPHVVFETSAEQENIRRIVRHAAPDVLLVALGAPKQEVWIAQNKDCLGVPVSIGVGGAFEMAAGMKQRAPGWIQRVGLEWLYRFAQEPRRLFRRYWLNDAPYLLRTAVRSLLTRVIVQARR
jgi:N-acetylglucosaminyldiphosphoundecaprenol N-acetyl-beta-D-mannosaminyltransferase